MTIRSKGQWTKFLDLGHRAIKCKLSAPDVDLCVDTTYSTVALVPPMSTMDVWRGITYSVIQLSIVV